MPRSGNTTYEGRSRSSTDTWLFGSSRSPKMRAPVGQATTQRGSRPSVTRCTQKVHFSTTPLGRAGVSPTTVTLAGGSCTGVAN